jgi:hypothetical protein
LPAIAEEDLHCSSDCAYNPPDFTRKGLKGMGASYCVWSIFSGAGKVLFHGVSRLDLAEV